MEIKTLNITEIRTNPLNIYEEQTIKELADSILQWGQLENATVYEDEQADGKRYTLVGGHRRFLAISYLAERNLYQPVIHVNVIEKPIENIEEKMMIVADNHQRIKDKSTKIREIQYANDYWNYLVSINQKPQLEEGQRKRDWIAKKTGYCARVVQDILTEIKRQNEPTQAGETPQRQQTSNKAKAIKQLNQAILNLIKLSDEELLLSDYHTVQNCIQTVREVITKIEGIDRV